jgi:hypothetical protein
MYPTCLWTYEDFNERLTSRYVVYEYSFHLSLNVFGISQLADILSEPYYGKIYANFSRFPPGQEVWRTIADPRSSGFGNARYITDWEYGQGGTVNIMLGSVSFCKLIESIVVKDKVIRHIGIHPMEFEWERFVTMIGSVFRLPRLEFSTLSVR